MMSARTGDRPTLLLLYDRGAAGPVELMAELSAMSELVVLTPRPDDRLVSLFADAQTTYPLTDPPSPALLRQLRGHRPAGLVTFSESLIPAAAVLAAELGLPYHSAATAQALTCKSVQRRLLRQAGVDAVRFEPIRTVRDWPAAVETVGLPCVIKPVRGEGSRNTFRVDTAEQGVELISRLLGTQPGHPPGETELLVEELLVGRDEWPFGDYVSVESIVVDGTAEHIAVTGKLPLVKPFRETCSYWPAALPAAEQAAASALTTRALAALGVRNGVCHTELKLTDHGARIIEVNGRLGGWVHDVMKRSCGISMIQIAAEIGLGRCPRPAPPNPVEPGPVQPDPVESGPPAAVTYIFNNLPPSNARRMVASSGAAEIRRLDGVASYRLGYRPGDELTGGVSTDELDVLRGSAADHAGMLATIKSALQLSRFTFETEPDGAPLTLSGAELPSAASLYRQPDQPID